VGVRGVLFFRLIFAMRLPSQLIILAQRIRRDAEDGR
jgi:hypothetical protein